jgi:hypothetical protein
VTSPWATAASTTALVGQDASLGPQTNSDEADITRLLGRYSSKKRFHFVKLEKPCSRVAGSVKFVRLANELSTIGKHSELTFFLLSQIKSKPKPLRREIKGPLIFRANCLRGGNRCGR